MSGAILPPAYDTPAVVIPPVPKSERWRRVAEFMAAGDLVAATCDLSEFSPIRRLYFLRRQADAK